MTGGVFEGDESAVPIAVFEVAGFIFFSGIRIWLYCTFDDTAYESPLFGDICGISYLGWYI